MTQVLSPLLPKHFESAELLVFIPVPSPPMWLSTVEYHKV